MTTIPLGDDEHHAVVFYDRKTQVCILVANSVKHLSDAIAIINTLNAGHVLVVAPQGVESTLGGLQKSVTLEVYEHTK